MDETTLMKIVLTISILGLLALFFISETLPFNDNLYLAGEESSVKIKGQIESISDYGDMQFFEIKSQLNTNVLVFDRTSFEIGDFVEIEGRVQNYKGKKEIIAEKMSLSPFKDNFIK